MKLTIGLLFIALFVTACTEGTESLANAGNTAKAQLTPQAEWTVMIFMNGDNNLEEYAIDDFLEMSMVGSTDRVNILTQFDRIDGYDDRYGDWTGTLRFRITKGMEPQKENALGGFEEEADMGAGSTVSSFVTWAQENYPANRYMLVIWDHGAGWRKFTRLSANTPESVDAARIDKALIESQPLSATLRERSVQESPVKSVSHDSTSGRSLYNREIQDNLGSALGGRKLDVIGFDACLMAMVETGYAMRSVAKTMVASEELEPGEGWQHNDWAKTLSDLPESDEASLGKALVESYKKQYGSKSGTTLSAVNLERMDVLASVIDTFSTALTGQLDNPAELTKIKNARNACKIYGRTPAGPGAYYNIDLKRFADLISNGTDNAVVRSAAQGVTRELADMVVFSNYAHPSMQDPAGFGSHGLAIYFPATKSQYERDPLSTAYNDGNDQFPVEFVKNHGWDSFLLEYFRRVP